MEVSAMPSLIDSMTPDQIDAAVRRYSARVAAGELAGSPLSTIRLMGGSGDRVIYVPRIEAPDALETLDPDAQVMVELADQIIREAAARRRTIVAQAPGGTLTPVRVHVFDPTTVQSLLVLGALAGG
jgi:cytochrome P450